MKISTILSTATPSSDAAREISDRLVIEFGPSGPDLAILFASRHHESAYEDLPALLGGSLGKALLVGASAQGVIADAKEFEDAPAIVLWAASFPGVRLEPLRLVCREEGEGHTYVGWPQEIPETRWAAVLVLADPFSNIPNLAFEGLAERFGEIPVVGGIASGGGMPGSNALFLGDKVYHHGLVGVAVGGAVSVEAIVSQGCRPIGRHFVVTEARENVIYKIAGMPALKKFEEVFRTLTPADQELARHALHVGRVVDEYKEAFGRGDFLIRNFLGFDRDTGALVVNDRVRTGQTIQFHVRDAKTASEDLALLLEGTPPTPAPAGALLFSCNGRGSQLFGAPDHDAGAVEKKLGPLPLAGFFANGEIGPIAGRTCLHGFTASIALFRPPSAAGPV